MRGLLLIYALAVIVFMSCISSLQPPFVCHNMDKERKALLKILAGSVQTSITIFLAGKQ